MGISRLITQLDTTIRRFIMENNIIRFVVFDVEFKQMITAPVSHSQHLCSIVSMSKILPVFDLKFSVRLCNRVRIFDRRLHRNIVINEKFLTKIMKMEYDIDKK